MDGHTLRHRVGMLFESSRRCDEGNQAGSEEIQGITELLIAACTCAGSLYRRLDGYVVLAGLVQESLWPTSASADECGILLALYSLIGCFLPPGRLAGRYVW